MLHRKLRKMISIVAVYTFPGSAEPKISSIVLHTTSRNNELISALRFEQLLISFCTTSLLIIFRTAFYVDLPLSIARGEDYK